MLQKISAKSFAGYGPIRMLYPGTAVSANDSGIGSIGRIDHATFKGKHHIPMHPHVNDEILSYFRSGSVKHLDSEGFSETIGGNRLMLMKAGKRFYHEEWIDGEAEPHEGLQIFIRPGVKDLKPEVVFQNIEHLSHENQWRMLASPTPETTFHFSSQTWIYDLHLQPGRTIGLPPIPREHLTGLLYQYDGSVVINGSISLSKMDSLIVRDEVVSLETREGADLVLFLTDEGAPIYKEGMYSGNQINTPY